MSMALRVSAPVFLFLIALGVFYFGLLVGLQVNPNVGTLMWLVSAAIFVANILWIVRSDRRRPTR